MNKFKENSNTQELVQQLSLLGEDEQKLAGDSLESLKRPVQDMLQNKNSELPEQLFELRQHVSTLEPEHLNEGFLQKKPGTKSQDEIQLNSMLRSIKR
ncbi:hypothetical protein [Geomicrobium sp. JCM 19055]|uniref:hypothetical protein n=1 Tax=Geomicrobium sp. JCM 19055 TaxID=1460649 RepID=UPI00351C8A16